MMVERVARAICRHAMGGESDWSNFVADARSAIEAMREPTDAMIIAGVHHDNMGDMAGRWMAMIDAALA